METIIYILRHGQSVTNNSGVFSGSNEVDLSPLGEKQAEKASEYLIDKGIDFIYSSPLSRAINTALPLAKKLGKQIEIEKDFREICFGSWEGKTKNYLEQNEENFLLWREHPVKIGAKDGEKPIDAGNRFAVALEKIARENLGKTILITAHGGVLVACMCYLGFLNSEEATCDDICKNAGISKLIYKDGKFSLEFYAFDEYLADYRVGLKLV